eukprot:2716419-Alexandrium_andersonii.AAC.1
MEVGNGEEVGAESSDEKDGGALGAQIKAYKSALTSLRGQPGMAEVVARIEAQLGGAEGRKASPRPPE